jgi:hypothetical protein
MTHTFGLLRSIDLKKEISSLSEHRGPGVLRRFNGFGHFTNLRSLRTLTEKKDFKVVYVVAYTAYYARETSHGYLSHSRRRCDLSFKVVSRFVKLERLDISFSHNLTEIHMQAISSLRNLTYLNLHDATSSQQPISVDSVCSALSCLINLTELVLPYFAFSEVTGYSIIGFTKLNPRRSKLKFLECLQSLKMIQILYLPPIFQQWEQLNVLPLLRELCISDADTYDLSRRTGSLSDHMWAVRDWVTRIDSFRAAITFRGKNLARKSFLSLAAGHTNSKDYVEFILSKPRNNPSLHVNFVPSDDLPPIFYASTAGALEALVAAGANINAVYSRVQLTPLVQMLRRHRQGPPATLVECALKCGADPVLGCALEEAINLGRKESFQLILDSMKGRILEYDQESLSRVFLEAFCLSSTNPSAQYFRLLRSAIGESHTQALARANDFGVLLGTLFRLNSILPTRTCHCHWDQFETP